MKTLNKFKLAFFVTALGVCIVVPGGILGLIVLCKIDPVSFAFTKNKIPFLRDSINKIEESAIYKKGTTLFK